MLEITSIFNVPHFMKGVARFQIGQMIEYGKELRDTVVWQYPILPGALMTYQQIASSREIKVSGPTAIAVSRAIDWLNDAVSNNLDGTVDIGYENILKRRIMDYLCIGRTIYHLGNGELEYIDPAYMRYIFGSAPFWQHSYTAKRYAPEDLIVNHPYPLGSSGWFMSPIVPIIPKAQLAWLLDEHDRARADGRKIRDIIIAGSKELADTLAEAVALSAQLYSGDADVSKNGTPLAYLSQMPPTGTVQDMIGRLGIAEIPENFDRATFEFGYVNVIAANLGLALRHFWNSEKATNRALEDMQEARQLQKGPNEFIRTEQRLLNYHPQGIRQFGQKVRMGFIEEADTQTKQGNAEVLKAYSDALLIFAQVFNGTVNGDAFLAWLQSEDILPADLELVTSLGTMVNPDAQPITEGNPAQGTQPAANSLTSGKKGVEKSMDELDYGEIAMDLRYNVLERRLKVYSVPDMVYKEIEKDAVYQKSLESPNFEFQNLLLSAQKNNYEKYVEKFPNEILTPYEELTAEQHYAIAEALNETD